MQDKCDTVGELFDHSIHLEKATETVYRQIGEMFAHHPEIAQFWARFADDEAGHASQLERVKAEQELVRLSEPANEKIVQYVQKCLHQISQVRLDQIRHLEDAYQLATELENSETNTIFEFMILNFKAHELVNLQKFLRDQLKVHLSKLKTGLPEQYRNSVARRDLTVLDQ